MMRPGASTRPRVTSRLFATAAACLFLGAAQAQVAPPLTVVASIFPLQDMARQVGGDAVRVTVLVPPGTSPHGYEPKPAQVEVFAHADLALTIGRGFDPWADRLADASGRQELHRLSFARAIARATLPGPPTLDPHVWLDPILVETFVDSLAATLIALRPAAATAIAARAAAYRAELDSLDRDYRAGLAALPRKSFVTFHSAFHFLAARYGLEQVSVFSAEMEEPGPADLERVARFVRDRGVTVLFVQPQLPLSGVAWLREQAGLRVATLDPLENASQPDRDTYVSVMRRNLDTLTRELGR
jgi:zinc transport system substrate-binding protein